MGDLNDKLPGKINPKNLDEASEILGRIMKTIHEFGLLYNTLTSQEKSAIGGIIFGIVNTWNDSEIMGTVVERPLGAAMINKLAEGFNRRIPVGPELPQIRLDLKDINKKPVD